MKRFLVVVILLAGLAAVAYASYSSHKKKTTIEKKEMKKNCKHRCLFS